MECTPEWGLTVRFPVLSAQGNVEDTELKYAPKGQPFIQRLLAWPSLLGMDFFGIA